MIHLIESLVKCASVVTCKAEEFNHVKTQNCSCEIITCVSVVISNGLAFKSVILLIDNLVIMPSGRIFTRLVYKFV
jgi:hypothetical protein